MNAYLPQDECKDRRTQFGIPLNLGDSEERILEATRGERNFGK